MTGTYSEITWRSGKPKRLSSTPQHAGAAQLQRVACAVKFLGAMPHRLPVGAYRSDGACRVAAALQQGVHHLGVGLG